LISTWSFTCNACFMSWLVGWFILRPCQHDNGYTADQSQISVHVDEWTKVHCARFFLVVTHPNTNEFDLPQLHWACYSACLGHHFISLVGWLVPCYCWMGKWHDVKLACKAMTVVKVLLHCLVRVVDRKPSGSDFDRPLSLGRNQTISSDARVVFGATLPTLLLIPASRSLPSTMSSQSHYVENGSDCGLSGWVIIQHVERGSINNWDENGNVQNQLCQCFSYIGRQST